MRDGLWARSALANTWIIVAATGLALASGGLLGSSCGDSEATVLLTIESRLSVPQEVDRLVVRASAEGFADRVNDLDIHQPFPHTVELELESGSARLTINVLAMKGDIVVNGVQLTVSPVAGEVTGARVTV